MTKKWLFLFLSLLACEIYAKDFCNNTVPAAHDQFASVKTSQEVKKLIYSASQNPLIAMKAGKLFTRLKTKESPVLINWVKKRNLRFDRPEELIKKWQEYFFTMFILNNYKEQSKEVKNFVNTIFDKADKTAFSEKTKKKINEVFNKTKKAALETLYKFKMDKTLISKASERIKAIKLYWFAGLKGSKFEDYPLEFLEWQVAYDPLPNEINIGIKALEYKTEENLFAVFAHEMGHAIDSCRWDAFIKTKNPFKKVNICLRSKESGLNAHIRDDSQMKKLVELKKMSPELAQSLLENPTCNKKNYPPIGTQKDQLPEIFADWFSAEVVAVGISKPRRIRDDLCKNKLLRIGSSYLPNNLRLNRIYLNNPEIKKKLGIAEKSNFKYCAP